MACYKHGKTTAYHLVVFATAPSKPSVILEIFPLYCLFGYSVSWLSDSVESSIENAMCTSTVQHFGVL